MFKIQFSTLAVFRLFRKNFLEKQIKKPLIKSGFFFVINIAIM